jgi:hypothetical protein
MLIGNAVHTRQRVFLVDMTTTDIKIPERLLLEGTAMLTNSKKPLPVPLVLLKGSR